MAGVRYFLSTRCSRSKKMIKNAKHGTFYLQSLYYNSCVMFRATWQLLEKKPSIIHQFVVAQAVVDFFLVSLGKNKLDHQPPIPLLGKQNDGTRRSGGNRT